VRSVTHGEPYSRDMPFHRRAGLTALVWIAAALVPPGVALGSAGDECGTVGAPPAGNVVVAAGTVSCADAIAVVNRYLTDPSVVRDGEWVRFDGWDCWAPSAGEAMMNGFGTECSRGVDNIQIRN
jgi:hypothetical protein